MANSLETTGGMTRDTVENKITELAKTDPERANEMRARADAAEDDPDTLQDIYDELDTDASDEAVTNKSERA